MKLHNLFMVVYSLGIDEQSILGLSCYSNSKPLYIYHMRSVLKDML